MRVKFQTTSKSILGLLAIIVLVGSFTSNIFAAAKTEAGMPCVNCGSGRSILDLPKELILIGNDDRRLPTPNEAQALSGIGKIVCSNTEIAAGRTWESTGWLALERHILTTNKHAFINLNHGGTYSPEKDCLFRLFDIQGNMIHESKLRSGATTGDAVFGGTPEHPLDTNVSDDWAVVNLVSPAPSHVKPLGIANGDKTWLAKPRNIILAGFHLRDSLYYSKKYISENCQGFFPGTSEVDPSGLAMRHTCDTDPGASGSPIMYRQDNGDLVVIGVHFAGPEMGDSKRDYNRAVRLDGRLRQAIESRILYSSK